MAVPNSKSEQTPGEREKVKRIVARRGLCGVANDTKWDEFIEAMRARVVPGAWVPSYRVKCVDGPVSGWDCEWFYHLPFPMVSTEWLDIAHIEEVTDNRLPRTTWAIDHSLWIEQILTSVGLQYTKDNQMIRVFGYNPMDLTLFDR